MATLDKGDVKTGVIIETQGFMKKVTFITVNPEPSKGVQEEETVFVSDKSLDIQEDREEILRRAQEQRS